MITIFDPRVLQLPMPFDAKLCNYHLDTDGYHFKIETIAEYLTRVDLYNRSMGVIVAMAIPKEGYSAGSFPIDEIETFSTHFDNKWYSFIGGINDQNFVELVFAGNDVISGPGMDFITNTPVTLGLPSEVNSTTINEVTEHSHTHKLGNVSTKSIIKPDPSFINYGALYNWFAVTDSRKITSSDDWAVPEKTDWDNLLNLFDTFIPGINIWEIGGNLKENGLIHWLTPNEGGIGKYNLNLVGCGNRNYSFGEINEQSAYWTSTQVESLSAYSISFYYQNSNASLGEQSKELGNPCRINRIATVEELLLPDGSYCDPYVGNDLKIYNTVKIGARVWLAENLNETKYRNGDWIYGYDNGVYTPISNEDWVSCEISGESLMCCYADNEANGGGEIPLSDILISEHNKLKGLDGGDPDNNYYGHLTQSELQLIQSFSTLPTYANNTTALSGGLQAGNLYKTTIGQLMIVY